MSTVRALHLVPKNILSRLSRCTEDEAACITHVDLLH
jgi:hypothetical protein